MAALPVCKSPRYPAPSVSAAEIPGLEGISGFCKHTSTLAPMALLPSASPSLQEAGGGHQLHQMAECEQRTVRNWDEITKSIRFIQGLSLGFLGESECLNPLWELIPCPVIIQASLKYALCWRSNQITAKNLEWEKCWVFFHQPECLVISVFNYLYCACHCGMSLYKQRDALNLLLF